MYQRARIRGAGEMYSCMNLDSIFYQFASIHRFQKSIF